MLTAESSVLESRPRGLSLTAAAAGAVGLAVALALAAQVRIPLPFTPVPITLQTLVLYVGAAWLGARVAIPGLALYVGAALLGAPVMSGLSGGLAAFTGATGGYIVGWFVAALLLSVLLAGEDHSRGRVVVAMAGASAVVLACGALHLAMLLRLQPAQAVVMGVAPFLPGDALKILVASALVCRWPNALGYR